MQVTIHTIKKNKAARLALLGLGLYGIHWLSIAYEIKKAPDPYRVQREKCTQYALAPYIAATSAISERELMLPFATRSVEGNLARRRAQEEFCRREAKCMLIGFPGGDPALVQEYATQFDACLQVESGDTENDNE